MLVQLQLINVWVLNHTRSCENSTIYWVNMIPWYLHSGEQYLEAVKLMENSNHVMYSNHQFIDNLLIEEKHAQNQTRSPLGPADRLLERFRAITLPSTFRWKIYYYIMGKQWFKKNQYWFHLHVAEEGCDSGLLCLPSMDDQWGAAYRSLSPSTTNIKLSKVQHFRLSKEHKNIKLVTRLVPFPTCICNPFKTCWVDVQVNYKHMGK